MTGLILSAVSTKVPPIYNSLLNYGYAILYARVWKNILAAKLNPSIGVLHAKQDGKPTLVFDVVELFRAQMVDRVVISLIQKVSLKCMTVY